MLRRILAAMRCLLRRAFLFALAMLAPIVVPACAGAPDAAPVDSYVLALLKTGPRTAPLSKDDSQRVFGGHMANMQRLAREGRLMMAGPYGKEKSDAALRGVFVLATADLAEAKAWCETDPGFVEGVFRFELAPMVTTAALREQLAADLAREDAQKKAGATPPLGSGMRGYVLLTAADGARADAALGDDAGVLLRSRLGDGRGWYVLDAKDRAAADALLGARKGAMGEVALDEWYATDLLADLPLRVSG
jgi:uncharacterized protein YciI